MRTIKTLAMLVLLLALGSGAALAQKKNAPPKQVPLSQFIDKHFAHWDRNHDDVLDIAEVDRSVEDHNVFGREAAVIFRIRERMTGKGKPSHLSHQQVLALAQDRAFEKAVDATAKQLETIDRELFLASEPDLSTFHQGRLGDCYLLCTVGAQVHRNPKAIREMIHPVVTGGFQVAFGNGQKIPISRLTDTELLLGAQLDSHHGSWLVVLEKAYAIIRERQRAKKKKPGNGPTIVPEDTLNGGYPGDIISLLTGQQSANLDVKRTTRRDQVHNMLVDRMRKRRLVCISAVVAKPPPGMITGHCYAIFGYDGKERKVTIFNPWGNQFTPKGPPGLANGYPTQHGQFTVPLDHLMQFVTQLVYETDKPLGK